MNTLSYQHNDTNTSDTAGLLSSLSSLRVAIVHYWFVGRGGGERVVEALADLFPQADLFALIARTEGMSPELQKRKLTTSFLQKIPQVHRFHRHTLMLQPLALEQFDLTDYDLVLSSESGPAKGVITSPDTLHVCYCHSPMRYIWDMYPLYIGAMSSLSRPIFAIASSYLRMWDYAAAARVDSFVSNSRFIASRIRKYYRRDSIVIHPPVEVQSVQITDQQEDAYLTVGRLVSYKRTDLAIEACNYLKRHLRVIGTGPEYKSLKRLAGPNIEFLGSVSEHEKHEMLSRCRALLFPGVEDFGIVPVEAQAHGRPVIAFGAGGVLETVRGLGSDLQRKDESTGIFFFEQSVPALVDAIERFEANAHVFNKKMIREHVLQFDVAVFRERMSAFLEQKVLETRAGIDEGTYPSY